jgi:hypothetical protein
MITTAARRNVTAPAESLSAYFATDGAAGAWTDPHHGTGRPPLDQHTQQLIVRLARENPRWAASPARASFNGSACTFRQPRSAPRFAVVGSIPRLGRRPRPGGRSCASRPRRSWRATSVCHEREGGLRCSEDPLWTSSCTRARPSATSAAATLLAPRPSVYRRPPRAAESSTRKPSSIALTKNRQAARAANPGSIRMRSTPRTSYG